MHRSLHVRVHKGLTLSLTLLLHRYPLILICCLWSSAEPSSATGTVASNWLSRPEAFKRVVLAPVLLRRDRKFGEEQRAVVGAQLLQQTVLRLIT